MKRLRRRAGTVLTCSAILAVGFAARRGLQATIHQNAELILGTPIADRITAGSSRRFELAQLKSSAIYELLVSGEAPGSWPEKAHLEVTLSLPGGKQVRKVLHTGDPDFYVLFQPDTDGSGALEVGLNGADIPINFQVNARRLPIDPKDFASFGRKPAASWQEASEMRLGRTVFAADDEIEYLHNREEGKAGLDWYWFEYRDSKPRLIMFDLDVLDRDVPVNLRIFKAVKTAEGPGIEEYTEGKDSQEIRHDQQNEIDSKLITRIIRPGKYYLQVKANHPAYQLRTYLYDVPPYHDPRQAVRTAMDYMVAEADSWFAHTPRQGSRSNRVENVTDETERCVACHAGHFTMRAALEAVENGYAVRTRPQFKFMIDKLYNSMAPLYGHPDTQWLRFDLAPGNGIGRMARMLLEYENYFSHRPTPRPADAAGYLELVYKDRKELPGNEFDGNRPISRFKVAADAWYDFNEFYKRTGRNDYREYRDKIKPLMLSVKPRDLEDVCEQTVGLVQMRDPSFAPQIQQNIHKIFAAQHDDGSWWTPSYAHTGRYDPLLERLVIPVPPERKSNAGLQFMAGEALYALTKAGVPASDPHLQKALKYLLPKQKKFGAWLDDNGELSLTPFLETKWAIKALSAMYPEPLPRAAHLPAKVGDFDPSSATLLEMLEWLDRLWDVHDAPAARQAIALLSSPYVIVRQAAAAALGKMAVDAGQRPEVESMQEPLAKALGDPSKLVSRAAAWSLRQILNDGYKVEPLLAAMSSENDRERRGATRAFAQYFYLALPHTEYLSALRARVSDPDLLVRIQATKAVWRWYYRTPDPQLRGSILDALLARTAQEPSEDARLNLSQALYTILDENYELMYDYWLPTMSREEDRQATVAAEAQHEMLLASKIAPALEHGNVPQQESILDAFGYYFLRGEIGNDYDFITFYNAQAADLMVEPLLKLLNDPSPEIRVKALRAAVAARGTHDVRLKAAALTSSMDPDRTVREIAEQAVPTFPTVTKPEVEVKYDTEARPPYRDDPYPRLALVASLPGVRLPGSTRTGLRSFCPLAGLLSFRKPASRFADESAGAASVLSEQQLRVVLPILEVMLRSSISSARGMALDWVNRDSLTQTREMAQLIVGRLQSESPPEELAKGVANLRWIIPQQSSAFQILEALTSNHDPGVQEALLDLLKEKDIESNPRTPQLLVKVMRENPDDPSTQHHVLALLHESGTEEWGQQRKIARELRKDPRVLTEVALITRRGRTAEAVKASEVLEKAYAEAGSAQADLRRTVEKGLAERLAELPPKVETGEQQTSGIEPLDFTYFVARVQTVLQRMHGDRRCMDCHAGSSNLTRNHLTRPSPVTGQYTESEVRSNYAAILNLVAQDHPEQSLILRKPLAVAAGGEPVHAGGKYWATRSNAEYQAILAWINGARLTSPTAEDRKELARVIRVPRTGRPDFEEFVKEVQPILDKKYDLAQGQSCVSCHSQHREFGNFHLIPSFDSQGHYSLPKLYANYLATIEFLNPDKIEASLVLQKPTSHSGALHAGGALWTARDDPDRHVVETWAKTGQAPRTQAKR